MNLSHNETMSIRQNIPDAHLLMGLYKRNARIQCDNCALLK